MFRFALPLPTALALVLLLLSYSPTARADLRGPQVAIIAAKGNAESQELADYYANARGIPVTHICLVDVPAGDECPRDIWENSIRPAIRSWLAKTDPDREIHCLTTVWGVPLKIGPAAPTESLRRYQAFLAGARQERLAIIRDAAEEFDSLAASGTPTARSTGGGAADGAAGEEAASSDAATPSSGEELKQIKDQLDAALNGAQGRINALPQGPQRAAAQNTLQQLVAGIGGAGIILKNLQGQINGVAEPRPEVVAEFNRLRGAAAAWVEARQLLEQRPPGIERDESILGLVERLGGQVEAVAWLDAQIAIVANDETAASFDSELALVRWDDNYELLRWQPNYLQARYSRSQLRHSFPTIMTARLDAPTLALARGLIDNAIAAERAGLAGKAYIDSRGLSQGAAARGESAEFDRSLVRTAEVIRARTTVEVALNDEPRLFAAGECPEAAFYCGWYSLGKYVDAFEFSRGAVAFHVASDEADGLHDPNSQRWCKRLLEDGAAATVGAVYEPYLTAFPRPDEFFLMLLGGDRTLAECYWQSQPMTSWSMVLIGDPLYRPYRNRHVKKP